MTGNDRQAAARAPRTYLRRRGRRTRGQARALETLAPRYLVRAEGNLDPAGLFGREAPLGLEIGFGMGQALVAWAHERPDWNLLGVEVYQPGLGAAMLALERHEVDNVRVVEDTAERVLEHRLEPGSLHEVRIFFPDPWPKKRHHKRRLLQRDFAARLASRLRPGALLWVATDWDDYARWIVEVLNAEPSLEPLGDPRVEAPEPDSGRDRPGTRFEARGRRLGHRIWDLRYRRKRCSTESR